MEKWTKEHLDTMRNLEGLELLEYMSRVIFEAEPQKFHYYTTEEISDEDFNAWRELPFEEFAEKIREWGELTLIRKWEDLTDDQRYDMMDRVQMAFAVHKRKKENESENHSTSD